MRKISVICTISYKMCNHINVLSNKIELAIGFDSISTPIISAVIKKNLNLYLSYMVYFFSNIYVSNNWLNSLMPNDIHVLHKTWSTLVQVMAPGHLQSITEPMLTFCQLVLAEIWLKIEIFFIKKIYYWKCCLPNGGKITCTAEILTDKYLAKISCFRRIWHGCYHNMKIPKISTWNLCYNITIFQNIIQHVNRLVQERQNSSALAMELRLYFINPSIYACSSNTFEAWIK